MKKPDNPSRRNILLGATSVAGGISVVAVAAPFVRSLEPSRKTRAEGGPTTISILGMKPGELRVVEWRRKPVWILHRTPPMLEAIAAAADSLADPESESSNQPVYCRNKTRSIKPEIFVAFGICTHLGCSPARAKDSGGGFLCACHGSRFDFAGRVFKNSPAPANLMIPPHRYASDDELIVGEDEAA